MMYNLYNADEKLEVICELLLNSKDLDLDKTYICNELYEQKYDNILTYITQERLYDIQSSGVDIFKVDERSGESTYTLEQEYVADLLFEARCRKSDRIKRK